MVTLYIKLMLVMFSTDGLFGMQDEHTTKYNIVYWIDLVQQLTGENEQMKRQIDAIEDKLDALLTGKTK